MKRLLNILCCGLILFHSTGCTTRQMLRESSRTADETVFNREKTATVSWRGESAPDLRLPEVQAYVTGVLKRLAQFSRTPATYSVRITDDIQVNGQSLPGGVILVTRGMLNSCHNEAELAGYIGHEIGHSDLGHVNQGKEQKGFLNRMVHQGLSYLPDATGVVAEAEKHAEDIQQARFSQKSEEQADEYGAMLTSKAGYDPYALADLFERLGQKVGQNSFYRLAKLKGSHKALDARADHLRSYLQKNHYPHQGETLASHYQQSLASLVAYQGASSIDPKTSQQLDGIQQQLKRYETSGEKLPTAEFIRIMRQLSDIRRGASPEGPTNHEFNSNENGFMEEAIFQQLADWAGGPDALVSRADGLIKLLGHLSLGIASPPAAVAIGLYEALSGRDFMLDQPLSTSERVMAGAFSLVSAGAAMSKVSAAMKEAAAADGIYIAKGSEQVAKELAEALPAEAVVLGRNMQRVRNAAKDMGADVFEPAGPISRGMQENEAWLRQQIRYGKRIFDIGMDPLINKPSNFYNMEHNMLSSAGYYRQYVKDIHIDLPGRSTEIVKLYEWIQQ